MLDSCLLYLSSSMLQVWAAILVYVIFKKRDSLTGRNAELYQLWSLAREWWSQPLRNMIDPNPPSLLKQLVEFGLDEITVKTADANLESFIRTILSIKKHQLILKMGKSFSDTAKIRNLSPQTGQIALDTIADKVEKTQTEIAKLESKNAMGGSFFGISGNLIFLTLLPVIQSNTHKGIALFVLGLGNLILVLGVLEEETLFRKKIKA